MSSPRFANFERGNPPEGKAQIVVAYKTSDGSRLQMRGNVDVDAATCIGNDAIAVFNGSKPAIKAIVDAVKKADSGEYGEGAARLMRELLDETFGPTGGAA